MKTGKAADTGKYLSFFYNLGYNEGKPNAPQSGALGFPQLRNEQGELRRAPRNFAMSRANREGPRRSFAMIGVRIIFQNWGNRSFGK